MIVPAGFRTCPRCDQLIIRDAFNPSGECVKECRKPIPRIEVSDVNHNPDYGKTTLTKGKETIRDRDLSRYTYPNRPLRGRIAIADIAARVPAAPLRVRYAGTGRNALSRTLGAPVAWAARGAGYVLGYLLRAVRR